MYAALAIHWLSRIGVIQIRSEFCVEALQSAAPRSHSWFLDWCWPYIHSRLRLGTARLHSLTENRTIYKRRALGMRAQFSSTFLPPRRGCSSRVTRHTTWFPFPSRRPTPLRILSSFFLSYFIAFECSSSFSALSSFADVASCFHTLAHRIYHRIILRQILRFRRFYN